MPQRLARGGVAVGALAWTLAFAASRYTPADASELGRDSGRNVILLTWDGVRRDELIQPQLLPYLTRELEPRGRLYGDPRRGDAMTIGNPTMVSLPGYQSILAGRPQPCQGNDCGQTGAETFPERLIHELRLPRKAVATIASWQGLTFAVEEHPGTTFVNAGATPLLDGGRDPEVTALNAEQDKDRPSWDDARWDRYTWRQARRYLRLHRPRFLFVSMNDADAWGHRGNFGAYQAAIRSYDAWLKELVDELRGMGEYGAHTCLMITTDHGRGRGAKWTTHSNGSPYSGMVLMYAGCPLAAGPEPFVAPPMLTTHLDIRPTIERLFGLKPEPCALCGRSLAAADPRTEGL